MDESAPEDRRRPHGDPTPERDEIIRERGIDPIGGMTPAKRNTALIFAGTAMVLGIILLGMLWVVGAPMRLFVLSISIFGAAAAALLYML